MTDAPTTHETFKGWPLTRKTVSALVAAQPRTVLHALALHGVGRKTTKRMLQLGLLIDPEEFRRVRARARNWVSRRKGPTVPPRKPVPLLVPPDLQRHETPCSTAQRVSCCAAS